MPTTIKQATSVFLVFAVLFISLGLASCAQPQVQYKPGPSPVPVQRPPVVAPVVSETIVSPTSKIVAKNKDTLWRSVSASLSGTAFAISSVDFKTGHMQLRYKGDPRGYIDCGRVLNTVNLPTGPRTYDFPAAIVYQQYQIMNRDRILNVDRRMNLEAQIQLSMQAIDATRTSAQVQTRYGVTRDQTVTPLDGGVPFSTSDAISFSQNESATFPNAATRCAPTSQLENEVMNLVK